MASNFFQSLRRATRTVDNANQIDPLVTALRQTSNFDPSLHRMLTNGSFSLNDNTKRIRINGELDMTRADQLLRRGELRQFAREIKNPTIPSSRAESGFRTSITDSTPDLKIRQMDEAIVNARRGHADLDKVPLYNQTPEEFLETLTPAARRKLDDVFQKIRALAGTSLVVGGVIVVFIIGTDMLQQLMQATLNRRGCFQLTTTGSRGGVMSCRVISRSCWDPRDAVCDPNFPNLISPSSFFPTNVPLVLQVAFGDSNLAAKIIAALEDPPNTTFDAAYVQSIMTSNTRFRIVSDLHLNERIFVPNPCMDMMSGPFPGTETHFCRACDPYIQSTDPSFIDLSETENDNVSFTCIPSSSILDTIIDIGIGNGIDLLSPFGRISGESGSGTFILYVLVLVLLIIVAAVIFSIVRKKKD